MTTIRADVRVNSKLSQIERGFAIPLVEIAQQLVPGMVARIQRGQSSTGTFEPLGVRSVATPAHGLFWVSPKSPHPPIQSKGKSWPVIGDDGWAGYLTYSDYAEARGKKPRNFRDTNQLMPTLGIRVNGPGRVKVTFYGSHRRNKPKSEGGGVVTTSNSSVALMASRNEPAPMLTPTRDELVAISRQFQDEVNAQLIGLAADAQSVRQLGQRATRLQKRMAASSYARG